MNKLKMGLLALPAVLASGVANAQAVDYTDLTAAVDFSTTIEAIIVVFAALALVYVAYKGGRFVLRALR
jgi:hypothetical protein